MGHDISCKLISVVVLPVMLTASDCDLAPCEASTRCWPGPGGRAIERQFSRRIEVASVAMCMGWLELAPITAASMCTIDWSAEGQNCEAIRKIRYCERYS